MQVDFCELCFEDVVVGDGASTGGDEIDRVDAVVGDREGANDGDAAEHGAQATIDPFSVGGGLVALAEADEAEDFACVGGWTGEYPGEDDDGSAEDAGDCNQVEIERLQCGSARDCAAGSGGHR